MAVRLLLLVATCGWVVVSGELCEFPSDHPIQDLESGVTVEMENNRVYIYTDWFDSCHGCVRSLMFCYKPVGDELMTIEIGNNGLSTSHTVTVDSTNDRTNCAERYSLGQVDCCVEQMLTEPFVVGNHNWHYRLRFVNVASHLLRHQTETVAGRQEDLNGGVIEGDVYKPLFYFTIDPDDDDCSSDPSDPTDSTTTTTDPQSGPSSDLGSVAGGIAVVLVIVLLLIVGAVVGIMCLKKKQNKRKVVVSRARGEAGGISNVVYGAAGAEKMVVSSASPNSNTYAEKTKTDGKHQYECIEDLPSKTENVPTPYTYADALPQSQVEYLSYAVVGAEANAGKRPSLHYEVDSIYEAPASSEHGLYAQFEKIKIATIPRNTIEATECLGSGQFGTVNRGVWQSPSSTMEVAIKTLNSTAMEVDRVKFLQEGAIMGQFKHPNVVRLHGIVRDKETVLLVIELLGKDDLREHLLTLRPGEGEQVDPGMPHTLLSYCRQVASGLLYLSKKGFVHRDIAARNILLSEDQETCKIADFGMSRDLADETYYISSGGKIPVKWTAPEALHYKKYSTASDVWSFGCLMYEIWSLGHKPLEGYTNVQAIKMVDGGQRLAPPPGCPRAIYKLMVNCWNPVTSERPSSDSLSQSLARPDPTLLKWEASDKPAGVPEALVLGAPLDSASLLYPDFQRVYLPSDLTDNDYEEPS